MTGRLILKKLVKNDFPDSVWIESARISVKKVRIEWRLLAIHGNKLKAFPLHVVDTYDWVIIILLLGPASTIERTFCLGGASNYDCGRSIRDLSINFLEWVLK